MGLIRHAPSMSDMASGESLMPFSFRAMSSMPHCEFVNLSLTDLQGDKINEFGFYNWLRRHGY